MYLPSRNGECHERHSAGVRDPGAGGGDGDPLRLLVSFPETGGTPEEMEAQKAIIEGILPCHVMVEYKMRYMTWTELEEQFVSWEIAETAGTSWERFEKQTL